MMKIDLILFSSQLHDSQSVMDARKDLFETLGAFGVLNIINAIDYGKEPRSNTDFNINEEPPFTVCFIATGGTEEVFKSHFANIPHPISLLSDGYHNSFAASFEIATWLDQQNIPNELINIPLEGIDNDDLRSTFIYAHTKQILGELAVAGNNRREHLLTFEYPDITLKYLKGKRIGLIGGASSWLISSEIDTESVSNRFGVKFIHVPIEELESVYTGLIRAKDKGNDLQDAQQMYCAIKEIVNKYSLNALTIKCFDLLESCSTTSCLALAKLNDEGIISGCEGDIPSLWSMIVAHSLTQKPSFMANPSSSDPEELTIDFAHCTIPLSLTESYTLDTHFESQKSIAIRGILPEGSYSILKIGGRTLDKYLLTHGELITNTNIKQRCRTQIRFKFSSRDEFDRYMNNRLGNHIVIIKGMISKEALS